ncbi:flagellin, partial (plasmid) [Acetobacter orientalis]
MSLSINNNSSSLVALQALNAAQTELSKTENTVSTGKKVDNAADSPAIYSIAAQMNGNLQGMTAVSDSLSLGAQVVATANTAGNKIVASLQTLQNTVTTAGQTGTDASAMASQILSTLDSINSYARNATFSGVNLLTSGSDAVNAYNGTTLQTLTNVQGQTQTFKTMSGSNTTLVDALGLTSNSASGSAAADSTQNIFSSLNKNNVAKLKTGNLISSDIELGNGTTAGSTVTIKGKTFEFVQSGASVSTAGNIAVSLDSGFSTKNALSALVSSMNGASVNASLNSDNSIAVYTGGT